MLLGLQGCRATHLSAVKKDPTYDPAGMRRVFVVAVVKTERIQKMLEDEFVRQLTSDGRQAVASYTVVPHGKKSWSLTRGSRSSAPMVVIRSLFRAWWKCKRRRRSWTRKVVPPGTPGSGYYTYGSAYAAVYQPASYVREQTASIETKVFDVAGDKEVWSVHSKTEIAWGGDPEEQVRTTRASPLSSRKRAAEFSSRGPVEKMSPEGEIA